MTGNAAVRRQVRRIAGTGLGLALLLTVFVNTATLVVPLYDMQLYDRVLQSRNMDTLAALSVACALGLVLYAAFEYLRSACLVAIGEAVGRRLAAPALVAGLRRAAAGDRRAGTDLVRDLNEIQGFLASGAVTAPLDALCAPLFVAALFALHPGFGWVGIAGVSALVLVAVASDGLVRARLLAANDLRLTAGHELARNLADAEATEALGMMPALSRRWARRHATALAALDRVSALSLVSGGLSRTLRMALQACSMSVGAVLVLAGASTPGSLMGANLLVSKLLAPFDQLIGHARHWMLAAAAWRRIDRLLAAVPDPTPAAAAPGRPGLVIQGAGFSADDGRALLAGIDLAVPPGTLVAVTGPNGAGKTTLLRLLAGLVPPAAGTVLLDGAPVAQARIGYMPQGVGLLEGTLAENIGRFGEGPMDAAVTAARQAGVHEAIGRMPRGYEARLSSNGAALSGGMAQRVGLARALCGAPRLLVLDEPDASLDADGAAALLRALRTCCDAGAIAVVTTHRPDLRGAADMEVALRDGALA